MTDGLVDVSLTDWEDGIDLVLDTRVDVPPTQVWPHLVRSELLEGWFVGYAPGDDEDQVVLEMDDEPVPAHVLSLAAPEGDDDTAHVLVDIDGVGRLGVTLTPVLADGAGGSHGSHDAADDTGGDAEPAVVGTRIRVSHTLAEPGTDPEVLAQVIPQVGPVWETHLRMLAAALTAQPGAYDVPESQMTRRYEQLVQDFA